MPKTKIKSNKASKSVSKKVSKKNDDKSNDFDKKKLDKLAIQVKLLKKVVTPIVGVDAAKIVDLLSGKKKVNEFTIAEKLKITINQTRNILYKLSDEGLVSFIRKKDKKNGGWYTYFWTLETGKSLVNLKGMIQGKIKHLESHLEKRKNDRFYYCPVCDLEFNEEESLQNFFACVECGGVLELKDNQSIINKLVKKIESLKEDLIFINEEIEKIDKKVEAARVRKAKAVEKKKKLEREERRKERLRLKALEEKKLGKKPKKGVKKPAKKNKKTVKKKVKKISKKRIPKKKTIKKSNKKKISSIFRRGNAK